MTSAEQEKKIDNETKLLVELFLKTNNSDIELSKLTGISSSTVGRRLTNEDRIIRLFGRFIFNEIALKRQKNLYDGKIKGGKKAIESTLFLRDEEGKYSGIIDKIDLEKLSFDNINASELICHMALSFRCKIPTLSELLDIDQKHLVDLLNNFCGSKALDYLNNYDDTDQNSAKKELLKYYVDLIKANEFPNEDTRKSVVAMFIERVDDTKIREVKNKCLTANFDDADILTLLKYQVKYGLDVNFVQEFNLSKDVYLEYASSFFTKYPKDYEYLFHQFESLLKFYENNRDSIR